MTFENAGVASSEKISTHCEDISFFAHSHELLTCKHDESFSM